MMVKHSCFRPCAMLLVAHLGLAQAATEAPPPVRLDVRGFTIEGENPLAADETRALLQAYVGQHVGIEGLQAAADALEQAIRGRGHAFHRVVLPPQETSGEVRLKIVVFHLGKIDVKGAERFSRDSVLASLPSLKIGDVPENRDLAREIALANEHPARQVNVFMRESDVADQLAAEVRVTEQAPLSFFSSLNNSGPGGATGRWRFSLGVQKSDLFDADHALTASYTTSPDKTSSVEQWGLFYRLPLYPMHGAMTFFASDSNVRSGTLASGSAGSPFEVSGKGKFIGMRFNHRLRAFGEWAQQVELGVDDKLFINNTALGGAKVGLDVRSRPLTLRYEGQYLAPGFSVRAGIEAAVNLRGGGDNSDAAYAGQHPDARPSWSVWRSNLEIGSDLAAGWTVQGRLKLQESSKSLISGEQFGLGGAQSVRGFEEREVSGDRGWTAGVEFVSPLVFDSLRWQVFYEQGRVRLNRPQAGQVASESAASIGLGMRWQFAKMAYLNLDVAQIVDPLESSGVSNRKGWGKTHLAIGASF